MRLLLDQNLSPLLVQALLPLYPGSTHVRDVGLHTADDEAVWTYAAQRGFVIVSKDADFHQRSFLLGAPPKVIWIRRGNCLTIGAIGFEGRWDYGAIGTVTNLAARLCAEARPGEILVAPRVLAEVEDLVEAEELPPVTLKGFARPMAPLNVVRLRDGG